MTVSISRLSLSSVAAFSIVAGMSGMAAAQTIGFAHVLTEDTPAAQAAARFAAQISELSDGELSVTLFPAGQMGNDNEIIEQVQLGAVQMGIPPTAQLGNFEPRMQVFDLPYIFPTPQAAYDVVDGPIGFDLLEGLEDQGFKGLAYWESGFKQITSNQRPITSPDALNGLTVRTMDSPLIIRQYEVWGGNPVPMAFTETYNALQQGVADVQENTLVSIDTMNFYEVQDYIVLSNHGFLGYAVIMNLDFWNGLSEAHQEVVMEAAADARDWQRAMMEDHEASLLENMAETGVDIIELSPDELQAFIDASTQIHDDYAGEITQELIDSIYEAVAEYMPQ